MTRMFRAAVAILPLAAGVFLGFTLGQEIQRAQTDEALSLLVKSIDNTDRCLAAAKVAMTPK